MHLRWVITIKSYIFFVNKNEEYLKGTEKRATKNVQLVLQHCCERVEYRCCAL